MMKAQIHSAPVDFRPFEIVFGQPVSIGRHGGEFSVVSGSVWLTRRGDIEDHWLTAGHRVELSRDEAVLVEPVHRGQSALVAWSPQGVLPAFVWRHTRRTGLRLGARLAARIAMAFDSLAQRASAASRCA